MELTPGILLLAVLPCVVVLVVIHSINRRKSAPIGLLVISFLSGMAAVPLALAIIKFLRKLTGWSDETNWELFLKAFVLIALVEELTKFYISWAMAKRAAKIERAYDGIVYAVTVAMGFAAFENILYVMNGGAITAISRAVTAVPAHASFGIVMGFYMGVGRVKDSGWKHNTMGVLLAILLHGLYDYFLFIGSESGMYVGGTLSLTLAIYLAWQAVQKLSNFENG